MVKKRIQQNQLLRTNVPERIRQELTGAGFKVLHGHVSGIQKPVFFQGIILVKNNINNPVFPEKITAHVLFRVL